jgi:hypothetical protein
VLFERSPDTEARERLRVCDKHARASRGLRGIRTDVLPMEGRRRVNGAVPSGGPQCHSMSLVTHDTLREKASLPACESSGVRIRPEISITQVVADPVECPLDAELPSKTATNSSVPLQREDRQQRAEDRGMRSLVDGPVSSIVRERSPLEQGLRARLARSADFLPSHRTV